MFMVYNVASNIYPMWFANNKEN